MDFNRVFVPLNNFFSTAILNPSLEIGTGYEVLTTFTACRERPSLWALPFCFGLLCRSGLAVRTAGKYQQGNQRSSQLRWFIFVQIYLLTNPLKCAKMSRALTVLAPEISIIPRGTNFVKCFFAQILDVENPVFCEY